MGKRKRVPIGRAHVDTDEELTEQSEITQHDIDVAKAHARKYGSARFNEFLEAEQAEAGNAV